MPYANSRFLITCSRVLCLWGLAAAGAVAAAPPGAQFQVNAYTSGDQQDPRAAALSNGQFVVVWDSEGSAGGDDSSYSVQARILDASGTPIGAAFQVNTEADGAQLLAAVDARGEDFVVVWQTRDGDGRGVAGRRYTSGAQAVGAEFQVNTYTTDHQSRPTVAIMESGRFLVTWDGSQPASLAKRVRARLYDEAGEPVGSPFDVDDGTVDSPIFAETAARGDEEFVVVWHGLDQGSPRGNGSFAVAGRRVAGDGSLLGNELRLSEASWASGTQPAVALDPLGGFFAAWSGFFIPGDPDDGILVRRFAQDGTPVGPAQAANQLKPGEQDFPELAVGPDGWLLLAWLSRPEGAPATIRGRFFSTVAPVAGPEFQVNTVEGYQLRLRVAWPDTGDPLVVWTSGASAGNDDDGLSVQGRIVAAPIFADGFEAGTPTGWSTSVGASGPLEHRACGPGGDDLHFCRSGATMADTQISAHISDATRRQMERYAEAHGVKKGRLVEDAILHHLQALRELPADIVVPPRLTVTGESFRAIHELIEGSGRPTRAMRDLMAGRPVDGDP